MTELVRYPRTPHLEGSARQPGDEDLDLAVLDRAAGTVVVEEKVDGANAALRFTAHGELLLQSRGHFLSGGGRERQFALFKSWAARHSQELHGVLGSRYVLYGEWLYAKHTMFYDALPHYFLEFDVLDVEADEFLDTPRRQALLHGLPVHSVRVVWQGPGPELPPPVRLIGPTAYQTPEWRDRLGPHAEAHGRDRLQVHRETDDSGLAEGLYLKVEAQGRVTGRYKWVRPGYRQAVEASGSHWADRPILPNLLAEGVVLF